MSTATAKKNSVEKTISNKPYADAIGRLLGSPPLSVLWLLECCACGGGCVKISEPYFGCATVRRNGTCSNLNAIKRDVPEATVLGAPSGLI